MERVNGMTKLDKAAEPSMEDILASIRRIVTDEPLVDAAVEAAPAPVTNQAKPVTPKRLDIEFDAVLDLVDSAPARKSPTAERSGDGERKPLRPTVVDDFDDLLEPLPTAAASAPAGATASAPLAPDAAPFVHHSSTPEPDARLIQAAGLATYSKSAVVPNSLIPMGGAFHGMPRNPASRPTWQYVRSDAPVAGPAAVVPAPAVVGPVLAAPVEPKPVNAATKAPVEMALETAKTKAVVVDAATETKITTAIMTPAVETIAVEASRPANPVTTIIEVTETAVVPEPQSTLMAELTEVLASLPVAATAPDEADGAVGDITVEAKPSGAPAPSHDASADVGVDTRAPVEPVALVPETPVAKTPVAEVSTSAAAAVDAAPTPRAEASEIVAEAPAIDAAPENEPATEETAEPVIAAVEPVAVADVAAAEAASAEPNDVVVEVATAPMPTAALEAAATNTESEVAEHEAPDALPTLVADAVAAEAEPEAVATASEHHVERQINSPAPTAGAPAVPEAAIAVPVSAATAVTAPVLAALAAAMPLPKSASTELPMPVTPPSFAALRSLARSAPVEPVVDAAAPIAEPPAALPPSWALARGAARATPGSAAAKSTAAISGDSSFAASLAAMQALFPGARKPESAPFVTPLAAAAVADVTQTAEVEAAEVEAAEVETAEVAVTAAPLVSAETPTPAATHEASVEPIVESAAPVTIAASPSAASDAGAPAEVAAVEVAVVHLAEASEPTPRIDIVDAAETIEATVEAPEPPASADVIAQADVTSTLASAVDETPEPVPALPATDVLSIAPTNTALTETNPAPPLLEVVSEPAPALAADLPATIPVSVPTPAAPVAPDVTAVTPQAAPTVGSRSLEDAVVDLLRPMLRSWIDANMPVMVEKALRAETAAKPPLVLPVTLPSSAPTQKPN
jgi:cell pole-organizing protein PopZ